MKAKERMLINRQVPVELSVAERINNFDEIVQGFTESSALIEASRCLQCKNPLCVQGCPIGNDIPGFIKLLSEKNYEDAYWRIRENSAMPAVCSRVCPHEFQCEGACIRNKGGGASVAIGLLERFVVDKMVASGKSTFRKCPSPRDSKVAIIGSGPASISVAYYLSHKGIRSTVFEAKDVIGGMLTLGIPSFRLPRKVIEQEFESLINCGVRVKTNVMVGRDITLDELKAKGYDAVFLGVGAHGSKKLGLANEMDTHGVVHGIDYLRRVFMGEKIALGKRVVIVGGGNVAIDVARTALREGAENVTILYRRTRNEMPASQAEILHLEEEGIRIEMLTTPVEIIRDDEHRLMGIECQRMELGEPDESGRRRPVVLEGYNYKLKVDTLIPAISQIVEHTAIQGKRFKLTSWGTYETNPETLQTSVGWVFAGGDDVLGPQTIAKAVYQGRVAAESIDLYLKGLDTNLHREYLCELPKRL